MKLTCKILFLSNSHGNKTQQQIYYLFLYLYYQLIKFHHFQACIYIYIDFFHLPGKLLMERRANDLNTKLIHTFSPLSQSNFTTVTLLLKLNNVFRYSRTGQQSVPSRHQDDAHLPPLTQLMAVSEQRLSAPACERRHRLMDTTKRITLTADRNHLTAAQKAASPRSTPRRFAKGGNRPPWDFTLLART